VQGERIWGVVIIDVTADGKPLSTIIRLNIPHTSETDVDIKPVWRKGVTIVDTVAIGSGMPSAAPEYTEFSLFGTFGIFAR
jgi:hypothetical protein